MVNQRQRHTGGTKYYVVFAKNVENRFQILVKLGIVFLDTGFVDKMLIAVAVIFGVGVRFYKVVRCIQCQYDAIRGFVRVIIAIVFDKNIKTSIIQIELFERNVFQHIIIIAK